MQDEVTRVRLVIVTLALLLTNCSRATADCNQEIGDRNAAVFQMAHNGHYEAAYVAEIGIIRDFDKCNARNAASPMVQKNRAELQTFAATFAWWAGRHAVAKDMMRAAIATFVKVRRSGKLSQEDLDEAIGDTHRAQHELDGYWDQP
jgi:hypothetical protein